MPGGGGRGGFSDSWVFVFGGEAGAGGVGHFDTTESGAVSACGLEGAVLGDADGVVVAVADSVEAVAAGLADIGMGLWLLLRGKVVEEGGHRVLSLSVKV